MSTLTAAAPKPIDEPSRLLSVDVVRGVALLGILAMNIKTFGLPFAAYFNPTAVLPYEGVNRWTYIVTHTLFDLKMMTLFSMLFGVGVMIYAEKIARGAELKRVRGLWFRRMGILLGIGLVHAYLIWEGDILVSYAVCGLIFLWWMRRLPAWAMVLIAIPFTLFTQALWASQGLMYDWFVNDPSPPEWMSMPADVLEEMRNQYLKSYDPTPEQVAELESTYTGSWYTLFKHRVEFVLQMHLWMIPTFMLWRGTAMMLLGAALYKWRVVTGERSTRFYAIFTIVNYAVAFPLIIAGIAYNESVGFNPARLIMVGSHFNGIGSVPMAMGHMGLVILVARAFPTAALVRALSAVGRMALTNYIAHSVICSLIFYGYGLALYNSMNRLELQLVVVAIWIAQLIWSPLWLRRYRFGPMEWLWRALTYGKAPPMRRAA